MLRLALTIATCVALCGCAGKPEPSPFPPPPDLTTKPPATMQSAPRPCPQVEPASAVELASLQRVLTVKPVDTGLLAIVLEWQRLRDDARACAAAVQ